MTGRGMGLENLKWSRSKAKQIARRVAKFIKERQTGETIIISIEDGAIVVWGKHTLVPLFTLRVGGLNGIKGQESINLRDLINQHGNITLKSLEDSIYEAVENLKKKYDYEKRLEENRNNFYKQKLREDRHRLDKEKRERNRKESKPNRQKEDELEF